MKKIACILPFIITFFLAGDSLSATSIDYRYDDLHRLISVEHSDGTIILYEYDDLGNRIKKTVVSNATSCSSTISPVSRDFDSNGGSQQVFVETADSTCTWSVSENLSWVEVSPAGGTGNGSVTVTVEANSGSSRAGTVTIAGEKFTITQFDVPDETIILDDQQPVITSGSYYHVYGNSNNNVLTLDSGASVKLLNFPGNNAIHIESDSSFFTVSRSGATVTFEGSDGTLLKMPATADIQIITFNDNVSLELVIKNNQVMMGNQVIDTTPAIITELAFLSTYRRSTNRDGYNDPDFSYGTESQPSDYVTDNSDYNDVVPTIHSATVKTARDDIDQNYDENDLMIPQENTFTNSLGMTFVYITPDIFMTGSPENEPGRDSDETLHEVTLTQPYYMQTTEVTQGQWETVMGSNPSRFNSCGYDCPVEYVSWNDAQDFINALNEMGEGSYSLPTEAQWESAVRAGSTTAFANGEITETGSDYDPNLDAVGWYWYNSDAETHPVAQKDANAWGMYDMHGNVSEWCQDWFGNYGADSVTDPDGPSSGSYRVLRGGSWSQFARNCRSAYRNSGKPGAFADSIGFRLVRKP